MERLRLTDDDIENDRRVIERELAKRSHERYMRYTWQKVSEPFLVGIHTKELCRLIDVAFEDFRNGKSTFLVCTMPFRHGKSDCLSRYLPGHFLGEFPDSEVMLVTYASSLAEGFSRFARNMLRTNEYHELYPNVEVNRENGGVQQWGIQGHLGGCVASGLTSGLTGKGYHLGLLDDYCSSRAEAESEALRNNAWEHFTNDFLTRRAPVSITIVLATPWHTDDIIGRIKQKCDSTSESYDPEFPPFKFVSFPAMDGDVSVGVKDYKKYGDFKYHEERKKYGTLFPERFAESWYRQQFASLGTYAAAALLQCNPQIRGGNLIDTSLIQRHRSVEDFPKVKYYRVWDLAHSEKQRMKDDPDWTSGTLLGFVKKPDGLIELWIKDVARIRAEAPERDLFINSVSEKDGAGVTIGVELSIDARDAVRIMGKATKGRRVVKPITTHGDKVSRMSFLEPIFEAGNVHILEGSWNLDWLNEVKEFPSGKHDDQVDNMSAAYELVFNEQKGGVKIIKARGV